MFTYAANPWHPAGTLATLTPAAVLVPAARGQHLPLKTFTGSDGSAHDRINKIWRDSHGFLWFGTVEVAHASTATRSLIRYQRGLATL